MTNATHSHPAQDLNATRQLIQRVVTVLQRQNLTLSITSSFLLMLWVNLFLIQEVVSADIKYFCLILGLAYLTHVYTDHNQQ